MRSWTHGTYSSPAEAKKVADQMKEMQANSTCSYRTFSGVKLGIYSDGCQVICYEP